MKLFVVVNDKNLRMALEPAFTEKGFNVKWFTSIKVLLRKLKTETCDMVIAELNTDIVKTCKLLSTSFNDIPIVVISDKSDEDIRIQALLNGADDFLVKPFSLRELLARIKAILRRSKKHEGQVLRFDGITYDKQSRIFTVDGKPLSLTKIEHRIIENMLENPEMMFPKEVLMKKVWGKNYKVKSRVLDVYISRLRKKLGKRGKYLKTLPKFGYIFTRNI